MMKASRWQFYVMEFLGIAGFVLTGALMGMLMENPASPVNKTALVYYPILRRLITGAVLGVYIISATTAASKLSGAHANPLMTWAYLRLNKITLPDAIGYVIFQFAGAVAAVFLLKLTLHEIFGAHPVNYSLSAPQNSYGLTHAFLAEFTIALIFVTAILFCNSAKRLEKYSAFIAGGLICLFVTFEQPYSGMSINPARSLAGAAGANQWGNLWIYFIAPVAGMFIASENFLYWQRRAQAALVTKPGTGASKRFWHTHTMPHFPAGD
ncbi:MIP/aquaporin family protein [Mucilaginibacter sp.]